MKKSLISVLIISVLVSSLFILTGCENKNENNNENNNENVQTSGVNLKYDFSQDKASYQANFNTTSDDKIAEFDEEEPNFVIIENEKEKYVLELTLDADSEVTYEQLKTSAEDENEIFVETKFGKYDGYYSDSDEGIYGYILLDSTSSDFYKYVMFDIYLLDEDSDKGDIETIFKSSKIQNMLNNVQFKTSKME